MDLEKKHTRVRNIIYRTTYAVHTVGAKYTVAIHRTCHKHESITSADLCWNIASNLNLHRRFIWPRQTVQPVFILKRDPVCQWALCNLFQGVSLTHLLGPALSAASNYNEFFKITHTTTISLVTHVCPILSFINKSEHRCISKVGFFFYHQCREEGQNHSNRDNPNI